MCSCTFNSLKNLSALLSPLWCLSLSLQNTGNRLEELSTPAEYVSYHHACNQDHRIEIPASSAYTPITLLPQNPYPPQPPNPPMYTFSPNPPAPRPPFTFPKEQSVWEPDRLTHALSCSGEPCVMTAAREISSIIDILCFHLQNTIEFMPLLRSSFHLDRMKVCGHSFPEWLQVFVHCGP